jgi:hypothetical protein
MAGRLTLLPPGTQQIQHWSRHPAPTNDPRSSSKSQAEAPRSSTPSWPTRLAASSTPSQATRAKRRCSRRGTAPKSPPSTGTVPVRAWFSVGRSSSAKSGWRVLSPTPSTCSPPSARFTTLSWDGIRIRSRMFTHGDSQLKWMQRSDRGIVSPFSPYD